MCSQTSWPSQQLAPAIEAVVGEATDDIRAGLKLMAHGVIQAVNIVIGITGDSYSRGIIAPTGVDVP